MVHVDSDAPLFDDIDGSLITDQMWGIYFKPDFSFGGMQSGAEPYIVKRAARDVCTRSAIRRSPGADRAGHRKYRRQSAVTADSSRSSAICAADGISGTSSRKVTRALSWTMRR